MKKVLFFAVLALGLMVSSCSNEEETPSIVGTWVLPEGYVEEIGLALNEDGSASGINTFDVVYKSWEKVDNKLVLKGYNTDNYPKTSFSDTLTIEKITDNELVLSEKSGTVTYVRKIIK